MFNPEITRLARNVVLYLNAHEQACVEHADYSQTPPVLTRILDALEVAGCDRPNVMIEVLRQLRAGEDAQWAARHASVRSPLPYATEPGGTLGPFGLPGRPMTTDMKHEALAALIGHEPQIGRGSDGQFELLDEVCLPATSLDASPTRVGWMRGANERYDVIDRVADFLMTPGRWSSRLSCPAVLVDGVLVRWDHADYSWEILDGGGENIHRFLELRRIKPA